MAAASNSPKAPFIDMNLFVTISVIRGQRVLIIEVPANSANEHE